MLLAVISLSMLSVACTNDATTCEEAIEVARDECENSEQFPTSGFKPKEESIASCNAAENKEEQIECANAGDCEEIIGCLLVNAFSSN